MRILHLLNHTMKLNGHVHAAVDLACEQAKMGHQVAIGSEGGDFDVLLAKHNVESLHASHARKPLALAGSVAGIRKLVRQWRPDVAHAHMVTSAVLAWPACKLRKIPLITTVHNEFEKSAILMGLGTRVITVSEAVRNSMAARGVSRSRLDVVLNGTIGVARMDNIDRTPKDLQKPAILFVGGMHPRKGIPDLLEAFAIVHAKHPEARLHLVGGGPFLEAYRAQANAMSCADAIELYGPQMNPYAYLLGADIFVLPSLADPAPLVISEAREAGCAVIASDVDGIPELLEGGAAGLLVPPANPVALADALSKLLRSSSELQAWRNRGQINIDFMTISRVARATLEAYARALKSTEPAPQLSEITR